MNFRCFWWGTREFIVSARLHTSKPSRISSRRESAGPERPNGKGVLWRGLVWFAIVDFMFFEMRMVYLVRMMGFGRGIGLGF